MRSASPRGRPPLLTVDVRDFIVNAVSTGATLEAAAEATGGLISNGGLRNWLARGNRAQREINDAPDEVREMLDHYPDPGANRRFLPPEYTLLHPDSEEERYREFVAALARARATRYMFAETTVAQGSSEKWLLKSPEARRTARRLGHGGWLDPWRTQDGEVQETYEAGDEMLVEEEELAAVVPVLQDDGSRGAVDLMELVGGPDD